MGACRHAIELSGISEQGSGTGCVSSKNLVPVTDLWTLITIVKDQK